MSDVKRCAACGKENPVSEMKVCMHHQMHRYVCDSKCMTDFYNPPKKPTAAELEAKVAALEAELATVKKVAYGNMELLEENAKLRAELERRAVPDGWKPVPVEPTPEMVSAAEEAHMPFGDMDIALRMAMLAAPAPERCEYCDGTGDVHGLDGEWKGSCVCPAGRAPVQAEPASPWVAVSERLPQIKQVLSEKCTLEGRDIPTLYRSGEVLTFDGKRVSAGIVEWFHGKSPLSGVTHWMPLPPAPEVV